MELDNEFVREALLPMKKAYEEINDKVLQTSRTYQSIIEEIHAVAEKLVDSIRKHESVLVEKASEMSVLSLRELNNKKQALATNIEEIENLLEYSESLVTEEGQDTNIEDKNEWESAIKTKMDQLCEFKNWFDKPEKAVESIEFKSLFEDPQLRVAFCHYGDISTSYGIKDEESKNATTGNLIDFDENDNIVNDLENKSSKEDEASFEAIPYL